ncbi:MAG: hypothetical protein ACKPJJ_17345, partial [Planctomycetaceae bacterium]
MKLSGPVSSSQFIPQPAARPVAMLLTLLATGLLAFSASPAVHAGNPAVTAPAVTRVEIAPATDSKVVIRSRDARQQLIATAVMADGTLQ